MDTTDRVFLFLFIWSIRSMICYYDSRSDTHIFVLVSYVLDAFLAIKLIAELEGCVNS